MQNHGVGTRDRRNEQEELAKTKTENWISGAELAGKFAHMYCSSDLERKILTLIGEK